MSNKKTTTARHDGGSPVTLSKADMELIDGMFPELKKRSEKVRLAIGLAKHFIDRNPGQVNIIVL
ncbi:hypothetical protein NIES2135_04870 [Leptolyngbya boryana NIES-2135]|jgi:hypothetical protein|uniref:Uncharacterized protein n=1 Tax=Leptolyngbya boryana NIES-2135 TaxID=1973484 RepID=A0A1Z4JB53_LEPBY|nr:MULTISPECIES: hypothetical protein [Leptolyngbya]BAY53677.1 hypothetical protein NIES2135_04870 [Leptolyngbya boryana NIES-2135]MBD2367884.1 hypothetical protein [Leptolyngbya sp. FACHB-161]MBD2374268.1 hypothetical protein [Leptolyngbya sp. FACHB-238]MBD2398491.1 hypothetical protein [Leptolyngbya sp. FACHB-239]MBD2408304.1 hypothetical protein [Leptolyngbya sp. FACHB-402]